MKHLFSSWDTIKKKLASPTHLLLAFDYDGTLTPLVKKPELAKLSLSMRNLLQGLSKNPFVSLVIISGRPLSEIKRLVGIKKIIYAGNHGLELKGQKIKFVHPLALKTKPLIKRLSRILSRELAPISGVLVENKGLTLSIHFRRVKNKKALRQLEQIFFRIIKPWQNRIKLTTGKKVYEIRPKVSWDKGKLLNELLEQKFFMNLRPLPIALGDDRSDEDMFKVIKNKGVSILVGKPKNVSLAQYFLYNTREVKKFLEKLI